MSSTATMTRVRLLAALQTLTMPDGALNVTHEQARGVVCQTLGLSADDLPGYNPDPQPTLDAYLLHWLGLELT